MKNIYLLLFLLGICISIHAQNAADYNFSVNNGVALENISTGATPLIGSGIDDASSAVVSIPFTFRFSNVDYTQFSVSSNGLLGFGNAQVDPGYFDYALIETSTYPILSAWADDLHTAVDGGIKYKIVTQNNGLRKVVIEWNAKSLTDRSTASFNKTWQIWLFEGSNKIEYVYGSSSDYRYINSTIGIASSKSDYIAVNALDHLISTTNPSFVNNKWPGTGVAYQFSTSSVIAEPITLSGSTATNVSCNGGNNGSITLGNITGGDGNYIISWTGSDNYVGSGSSISGLKAGVYNYIINDGSNAEPVAGTVEITEPELITLSATATNASCKGGGKISVTTNGIYTITDENGNDVTSQTEFAAGVYSITAKQINEDKVCFSNLIQVVIEEPSTINASVTVFPEYPVQGQKKHTIYLGYGSQSVTLNTNVPGAPGSYTYSWSPAVGLSNAQAASPVAAPSATTTYTVTITDENGCSVTKAVTIEVIDVRCGTKISVCKDGKAKCVELNQVAGILEKEKATLGPCSTTLPWDTEITEQLHVFPNPTTGTFWVELKGFSAPAAALFLINEHGKIISYETIKLNGEKQSVKFNLSNQPRGWYYIKAITTDGINLTKVFVTR